MLIDMLVTNTYNEINENEINENNSNSNSNSSCNTTCQIIFLSVLLIFIFALPLIVRFIFYIFSLFDKLHFKRITENDKEELPKYEEETPPPYLIYSN